MPVKSGVLARHTQKTCGKSGILGGFALYILMPFPYH
jgi:hypothetical protein